MATSAVIEYPDRIDGAVLKVAGVVVLGAIMSILDTTGVLVNDWYASGWQGPGPLPGTPK